QNNGLFCLFLCKKIKSVNKDITPILLIHNKLFIYSQKNGETLIIYDVYDEHAIIYNENFNQTLSVGDKVEIIPNHICPVVNLHEFAYLISKGQIIEKVPVDCRGKLK
ncbi:MAG: hypothetical protein FH753_10530, partial [Firmicutes bacterium]|nr:hypothetical protein [Bacillota bacterium]